MLTYGLLITLVGMGAVFAFLYVLTVTVRIMSWLVMKTEKSNDLKKVAALIAIAQGGK